MRAAALLKANIQLDSAKVPVDIISSHTLVVFRSYSLIARISRDRVTILFASTDSLSAIKWM